jgi:hypothetical protein
MTWSSVRPDRHDCSFDASGKTYAEIFPSFVWHPNDVPSSLTLPSVAEQFAPAPVSAERSELAVGRFDDSDSSELLGDEELDDLPVLQAAEIATTSISLTATIEAFTTIYVLCF